MTETDFRVKHSKTIEYYQLIEMRLRFFCADVLADEKRDWFARLDDYEVDPFGKLLRLAREVQAEAGGCWFSEDDFKKLDEIRLERNYWIHQCFGLKDNVTFSTGRAPVVRKAEYANRLDLALRDAVEWNEKLTNVCCTISKQREIFR
jgi:hypothetical protein